MVMQTGWLGAMRRPTERADPAGRASDGLTTFAVMWAIALIFSVVSHYDNLILGNGIRIAVLEYAVLASSIALILNPRRLGLLLLLAVAMALQYGFRLPVASNNQTIAFFMNAAIVTVIGVAWLQHRGSAGVRDEVYERLRIVARFLLAIMYFYGIFHKINVDFLDPEASCAVALYKPLTQTFGLADNIVGRYGSIASTFVVETITLVCLFWRRFFWVGLIVGLVFHYIIPISAYSWYMDFSSLVFALYTLSVPREVSAAFQGRAARVLRRVPLNSAARVAIVAFALLFVAAMVLATQLRGRAGDLVITDMMAWHSSWIVMWAVVGGAAMVFLTWAAVDALPYRPQPGPRIPWWVYLFPATLFVTCLSPYLGLKTESSIAMFSNLHTEGGTTNHLVLSRSLYVAEYQRHVATIEASSNPGMQDNADRHLGIVRFDLERWMQLHPRDWVTFTMDGVRYDRATAAAFPMSERNLLERKLLVFKPVDVARPKRCTH